MSDRIKHFNSGRVVVFILTIITIILVGAVLKITAPVVLPFTISLLMAIVVSPLVRFLGRFHVNRIVSISLIIVFLIGTVVVIGMLLFSSGRMILTLYPKYEARLTEIYIWVARFFELPYDEHRSFFENIWGQIGVRNRVRLLTISFSNAFFGFLSRAFLVTLFMSFLLVEAAFFREKLDRAFDGPRAIQIKKISSGVMTQITHYLSIKFFISVINGILIGVGLKIVGVEFAAVWGVIQFVVNFIPNIGSIAVGLAATAFAVVQFWPDPAPMITVALVMLLVNLILGCFVDPKIMGDRLGLSPFVVLVSLLVWGWLWGFAGLILAVPMTAIIKIVCENFPMLEPISVLLGSRKATLAAKSDDERKEPPMTS